MIENQSENIENPENKLEVKTENDVSASDTNDNEIPKIDLNSKDQSDEKKSSFDKKDDICNTDARLEQLEKEHETLKNQYVRIAADFDNFRKRQSRDQDDLKIQLICKSLSAILPIVDNFERARQQLKPESDEAQTLHRSYQGLYKP